MCANAAPVNQSDWQAVPGVDPGVQLIVLTGGKIGFWGHCTVCIPFPLALAAEVLCAFVCGRLPGTPGYKEIK